jgi:NTE family protein
VLLLDGYSCVGGLPAARLGRNAGTSPGCRCTPGSGVEAAAVDIVLIEPDQDDELMFQTNILNYTSRLEVATHGFQSVTVKLAADYEQLREVASRHGIEISATRVRQVVRHFEAEKEKSRAWRRILEQTTGALLRQSAGDA